MRKLLFIAGALVLVLTSCASGPTITVNSAPGTDLSNIQTFNFMQPLGTDRSNGTRTPMSAMMISSVSRELTSRGLKQSDSPDMLVDFIVTTEERMDVRTRTTPSSMHSVHRSHWSRGWYSTWPTYQTTVRQYTQGTLLIDFIDPNANALIAEGAAQSRLRGDNVTQQQMDEVVGQIVAGMLPS
jgi:hypothetical protein